MEELEVCLGVAWRTTQVVDEATLDSLLEQFDVEGGDPCITYEPDGSGLDVAVTWDARVAADDPAYEEALAQVRRLAERRFAAVGVTGRILSATVMTDEGQANWLADR